MADMGVNGLSSGNLPDECPGCPVDGPFDQALVHILDTHFSNPG